MRDEMLTALIVLALAFAAGAAGAPGWLIDAALAPSADETPDVTGARDARDQRPS